MTQTLQEMYDNELHEASAEEAGYSALNGELIRRYNNKKKEVRLYGDHLGGCEKRPCSCGFKKAYEQAS